jgi:hypothetical protein
MPSRRVHRPARSSRTGGAAGISPFGSPPVPDDVPIRINIRSTGRWLAIRIWTGVWLTTCAAATVTFAIVLIMVIAEPNQPGRADQIDGTIVLLGLLGVIWVQALLHYRLRRRQLPGFRRHTTKPQQPLLDLGSDTMVRIANVELALAAAFDTLGPYVSEDDLAMARRIGTRAAAALRDLRAQSLTLSRHTTAALAPDRQRLAAARRAVTLRLTRGLRDCEDVVLVANTPEIDDFRRKFTDAVERMSILVADINP